LSADGVLVVVPPDGAAQGVSPRTVVGGLPLLRRIVLAATTAGYARVLVPDGTPDVRDLLDGTEALVLTPTDGIPPLAGRRMVLLPANVVPQSRWLKMLREMPMGQESVHVDPSLTAVIDTAHAPTVVAAALRGASAEAVMGELRGKFAATARPLEPEGRIVLDTPGDVPRAEHWLLQNLVKQNEGFMSRHFERRLSLALTRRLATTSVTPNAMTLVSLAVGLSGAPFFFSSAPLWQLAGALLFLAHSILDGCDGELARLKFLQSARGAVLDYWGDNVVHVAVFGCIAIGWSLALGTGWPLGMGAIVIAAMLGSATVMFRAFADDTAAGTSVTDRFARAVAHRDFIYLVVLASAFGKAHWCLVVASVGAPAFLALVLWRQRRHGRIP
jgi:phosphatidylglycerophosphate synthase